MAGNTMIPEYMRRFGDVARVTPFTYRDGVTFLEMLESMASYVTGTLIPSLDTINSDVAAGFHAQMLEFVTDIEERVMLINNRVGPENMRRLTLPATITPEPIWPTAHPILFQVSQPPAGEASLTLGAGVVGRVDLRTEPGAVTEFYLVPDGNGAWVVRQDHSTLANSEHDESLAELLNKVSAFSETLGAILDDRFLAFDQVDNTSDKDKPLSDVATFALARRVKLVTTREELVTALVAGGEIHIGSTEIVVETPLAVDKPTRIVGGNIRLTENSTSGFYITSSNVSIEGTRFNGPGLGFNYKADMKFVSAQGTEGSPLSNVTVRDCAMDGSLAHNVWMEWVKDFTVADNTASNCLYSGVLILSGINGTIHGNTVKNVVMRAPVTNVYGIAATDAVNTEAGRSRNITISDNTVLDVGWEAIETHGGYAIVITGNKVINCQRGIALVVGNSTRTVAPQACVVTGNFVTTNNGSTREGISLFGIPGLAADATITGNTVTGFFRNLFADLYDRQLTYIGQNSEPLLPWRELPLRNGWLGNTVYRPQYMVDGRTVTLRGAVIPPEGDRNTVLAAISSRYTTPDFDLTFIGYTKGNNAAAGGFTTVILANGDIQAMYATGTDRYSYPLAGSFDY